MPISAPSRMNERARDSSLSCNTSRISSKLASSTVPCRITSSPPAGRPAGGGGRGGSLPVPASGNAAGGDCGAAAPRASPCKDGSPDLAEAGSAIGAGATLRLPPSVSGSSSASVQSAAPVGVSGVFGGSMTTANAAPGSSISAFSASAPSVRVRKSRAPITRPALTAMVPTSRSVSENRTAKSWRLRPSTAKTSASGNVWKAPRRNGGIDAACRSPEVTRCDRIPF